MVADLQDVNILTVQRQLEQMVTADVAAVDGLEQPPAPENSTSTTTTMALAEAKPLAWLWTPREVPSFAHFVNQFDRGTENGHRYPLLLTLLRVENRLSMVQGLADIFAWHRVLFAAVPPGSLTREQAGGITNRALLDKLPLEQRAEATALFERFAAIFNRTMPMLHPNLFECTPNPFLTKDRRVDLTGTGTEDCPMSLDVSVAFGLPARQRGETDARTICTLQMVDLLATAHNDLLVALTAAFDKDVAEANGEKQASGEAEVWPRVEEQEDEEAAAEWRRDIGSGQLPPLQVQDVLAMTMPTTRPLLEGLPPVTMKMDAAQLRSQLIVYDRSMLLPLITAFSDQNLEYSDLGWLMGKRRKVGEQ